MPPSLVVGSSGLVSYRQFFRILTVCLPHSWNVETLPAKHHNIKKKKAIAAETPAPEMIRSRDFLYVLVVCGAKGAVAWPCTHSEEVIRKLRPQINGNKNEKKKKNQVQCHRSSIPPPTCQRVTNFQAVAGHRQAESLGSRGYSWISCTAWQIMAGSSTARCAHHPVAQVVVVMKRHVASITPG